MKTLKIYLAFGILSVGLVNLQAAEGPAVVSAPIPGSASGSGNSFNPVFSADGSFLLFVSQAHNLVTNDLPSPYLGVFVYDFNNSNNILVSVSAGGIGGGNANCHFPSIYGKEELVAFASEASNLIADDTNNASDIFLRDLRSGNTLLVSGDLAGKTPNFSLGSYYDSPNDPFISGNPLLAGEGSLVFFESYATNLTVLTDSNRCLDIFVRNVHANTTALVSVNASGTATANGPSKLEDVQGYRYVVFTSKATDLVSGARTNGGQEVYVRDLQLQLTYWASSNALSGSETSAVFYAPVLSDYGHFVYYKKTVGGGSNA